MRKNHILYGALVLGVGVIVGTVGMSFLTNANSQGSFIAKLRGQNNVSTVSANVNEAIKTASEQNEDQNNESQDQSSHELETIADQAEQQIIADYKQDVGIFFSAWKSKDIDSFRLKLEKAYVGELLERHVQRAKTFLVQGIGLEATEITFDQVDVESADANTATLFVKYRYKAKDYSLVDGAPFGTVHEQSVKMRVNMLKQNSRWLITGESVME